MVASNFCNFCGARLRQPLVLKICPKCSARIAESAKFCPECGLKQSW
ncbi:MAG: zinc ribbon domain-containing protein [Candidatus Bathyarchaeota archaeon]|nr:zinc ribbon domain-containing protein [Candidatus Bathyarchaeota archaeon]